MLSFSALLATNLCAPEVFASSVVYTTYGVSPTSISWVTCGSTAQDEGCYGSGTLSAFGKVCAVLQGPPHVVDHVTRRDLYVFDSNYKNSGEVFLHIFKKTDTVSASYITTTFTARKPIGLTLPGGAAVACFAAENETVLVAGTSTSTSAVAIDRATLAQSSVGGISPPEYLTSIVADDVGYIAVNQGSSTGTGFTLIGPNGRGVEDGGGNQVIFNTRNAYIP